MNARKTADAVVRHLEATIPAYVVAHTELGGEGPAAGHLADVEAGVRELGFQVL